ncbi:MAG: hypothetical protein KDH92_12915, partial [Chloroflexi bacterium]|nr:hypothetical protein [Chloroflexota bacterium]
MSFRKGLIVLLLAVAAFAAQGARAAQAQTIGVVANGSGNGATIIDADTLTILGTVNVPGMGNTYDAYITNDQTTGYVCSFSTANTLGAIDLTTSPPTVSTVGTNPLSLPVSCEDISGTVDDGYLVVSDGGNNQPIVSVDIATFQQVNMISPDTNRNSVDVCSDGSVLMTATTGNARHLTIDASGAFVDTGESIALGTAPNNVKCSADSSSGVAVLRDASATLRSFIVQGMTSVGTQTVPGSGIGIDVIINNAGTIVYGRHGTSGMAAYDYDQATGVIGAQLWSNTIAGRPTYYGTDQMAITPDDSKLFVSTSGSVQVLDALTGTSLGSIAIADPRGIDFAAPTAGGGDLGPLIPVRPNDQLGKQVHLPILNFQGQDDVCRTWIEVQYIGCDPSKAVLVTWGEPGFCPPQAAGPLKVECTGLLQFGS